MQFNPSKVVMMSLSTELASNELKMTSIRGLNCALFELFMN